MEDAAFDQFTFVMLIMTLKEIAHTEIFRTNQERSKRFATNYPTLMAGGYVCSWGVTLWLLFDNAPAAIAGFLAAFLWEVLMTPTPSRKK